MTKAEKDKAMLGSRISFYRQQAGLSQVLLAQKAEISKSYMSRIEASEGETLPSLQILFKLADALDCPIANFFLPVQER